MFMERMKASDFPQGVLNLFDKYVHGDINRREFMDGASKFTVAGMTTAMVFEALRPNYAWAQQVAKDDTRIKAEYVNYPSPQGTGTMKGYFAKPATIKGKIPGVVVIHENRGLNPYIEDVARRLATSGYLAIAPDALTPAGGYPGDEQQAAKLFGSLDATKRTEDLLAAFPYLKGLPDCSGRIGAVGFCFGGQPPAAEVPKIKAAMLLQYAAMDDRINAGIPAYEAALKAANVKYEVHQDPGTQHGFHNDTTPRYDEAAAKLAWQRTLDHFAKHLRG
jgi:carboxymethylenebutenolidase